MKYVESYRDRHGKLRFYFTRKTRGVSFREPLPPPTNTASFRQAYEDAAKAVEQRAAEAGIKLRQRGEHRRKATRTPLTAAERREAKPGYIYAVQLGDAVKIGFATDVSRRLTELQVGAAHTLRVLFVVLGSLREEKALHVRFADHRIRGEWFRLEGAVAEWVSENVMRTAFPNPVPNPNREEKSSAIAVG